MQLQEQPSLRVNASPVLYGRAGYPPYYSGYPSLLPQSRSTSGSTTSATSAGSNQRSASPATSVASGHTSFSSASMPAPDPQSISGFAPLEPQRKEPNKKRRLYNTDRREICAFAREHPGVKQEDIAIRFRVERSTVSKILKQKARWLSVAVDEEVQVAKMRYNIRLVFRRSYTYLFV
ncbi:hypothetical protein C8Q79DRAFT_528674 [Trametes meyenii]|nr:hypothetical protein C8Q79DRAFT_528674 [Trametes meyenii]